MESRIVKSDFTMLNAFVKSLNSGMGVRVGIMGRTASRVNEQGKKDRSMAGNADIGAVHEFGSFSKNIPMRSFLRMPILEKSDMILGDVKKNAELHLSKGNIMQVLVDLGIAAQTAIHRAFVSSGFGRWPALKDPSRGGKNKRGKSMPLWDTGQLQRSITYEVVAK